MADLAMLLLVFFMTTTSSEPPKGVEVEMPKGLVEAADQESIYITISKQGAYYCDGALASLDSIQDTLALRGNERETPVSITADKDLPFLPISQLLAVLREADFLNVTFMGNEILLGSTTEGTPEGTPSGNTEGSGEAL